MKQFLVIFVLLATVYSVNCFGHGPRFIGVCAETSGAAEEDIRKVMEHEIPDNEPAQCFMACMMKKTHMMNEDNTINMRMVKRQMGPLKLLHRQTYDSLMEIFEECNYSEDIVDDDECISAKNIAECVIPKAHDVIT